MTLAPALQFPAADAALAERREAKTDAAAPTARRTWAERKEASQRRVDQWVAANVASADKPALGRFTIFDVDDACCRWPVNDGPRFLFCGAATRAEHSYCAEHRRLAEARR